MTPIGSLTARIEVNVHGALEDGRIGLVRRTLALWLIDIAQRLLRSRIDVSVSAPEVGE